MTRLYRDLLRGTQGPDATHSRQLAARNPVCWNALRTTEPVVRPNVFNSAPAVHQEVDSRRVRIPRASSDSKLLNLLPKTVPAQFGLSENFTTRLECKVYKGLATKPYSPKAEGGKPKVLDSNAKPMLTSLQSPRPPGC